MDSYTIDYNRASKHYEELLTFIEERTELKNKKEGTGRVDYRIKGTLESLKTDMRSLEKIQYLYKNNQ